MGRPRPHRLPRALVRRLSHRRCRVLWEAKCNIWSSCGVEYTRNYSYKVWTATKPALLEPAKLSPSGNSQRFSGRVDNVVYAKNAAQPYLLVVAYEEAKYRDTFETEIDREPTYSVRQLVLNPAGTTVTTVRELYRGQVARYRSCSENSYSSIDRPLTAHASRDGSRIALAYNRLGCTDVAFEVALFDAGSGAALGQTQLDLPGISANELSTGGATARGWIALSADTPAEAVDTELLTQLQDEDTLYNKGIISEGYQASKTRFQTRRQSLAQRDDNRQIFVVTQTNPFTNAIQGTHLIEVQNQSVSAKKFEGGSGNPIDLGARGTQIGNPDSDGAYYFDVVQRCYDNDCALRTAPNLNSVATLRRRPILLRKSSLNRSFGKSIDTVSLSHRSRLGPMRNRLPLPDSMSTRVA